MDFVQVTLSDKMDSISACALYLLFFNPLKLLGTEKDVSENHLILLNFLVCQARAFYKT
jgi:hypothetical protein